MKKGIQDQRNGGAEGIKARRRLQKFDWTRIVVEDSPKFFDTPHKEVGFMFACVCGGGWRGDSVTGWPTD